MVCMTLAQRPGTASVGPDTGGVSWEGVRVMDD